jgi:hypothetical protein
MTEDIGKPPIRFMQPTPSGEIHANCCPSCGAPVHFGDKSQVTCNYCGTEVEKIVSTTQKQPQDENKVEEEDMASGYYSGFTGGTGFNPAMYMALIAIHSTYSSTYAGMGSAHPAHAHGVGGFAG